MIATSGLSKDYGSGRGLFGLDLEVRQGEVFGFLGPNGAGKSTTMRLLLDLIRPTSGSAQLLGLDTVNDSLAIRRRVGFLPGDFALYPKLTGRAMLDYLAQLRGGVDPHVRDSLVERFGADIDRPIRQLSTGNRQKIGLVQAFMHEPELLILDEPIAGLDPLVQQSFHALLGEVSGQGRTVFLSSHTLSEVERVTHRLAILRQGRLVVVDSLENLRKVAVQRLEIEFAEPVDVGEFRALPGVTEVHAEGSVVTVGFEGSADAVVKAAAKHEVRAIRPREEDLEDIFLHYYKQTVAHEPARRPDRAAPATARRALSGPRADRRDGRGRCAVPVGRAHDRDAHVPKSVSNLLGGGDYGTITGWFRSEIAAIYGPLVIGALAITGASATTAGEEEDRIMGLVLAHPIRRPRLIAAKAAAIAVVVLVIAFATWIGLIVGVAVGGGGITLAHITALAVQLAFFGFATGAVAIALGAGTGRRSLATGVAAAVGIVGWLINSFAPLVGAIDWLKYISPFYYYAGHDPLTQGVDILGIIVLGAVSLVLTALGMIGIERRDLRA